MCGIGLFLNVDIPENLLKLLRNRGPDFDRIESIHEKGMALNLVSTVLSHQGENLTEQPLKSRDSRKVLMWNGEIYDHPDFTHDISDSEWLAKFIEKSTNMEDWWKLSSEIRGEFAFVFLNLDSGDIIFGRDRLG